MINEKTKNRELCYLVKVNGIEPIVGSDNCEAAVIGGWKVMVRKNTFKPNDIAIYFEIDSKVNTERYEFNFLEKYHGKIKTQRYTFGGKNPGFYSQGLIMKPADFGWSVGYNPNKPNESVVIMPDGKILNPNDESRFLTETLEVIYSDAEDNSRKSNSIDKYKQMAGRRPKLFKQPWARWMMKRNWGRKIMFFFFGKKKDKKNAWPEWVVKTDEERIQNIPWTLNDKNEWIVTEKIDGTSTTFTMRRTRKNVFTKPKYEFYVCSRNVVFDKPDKKCYYDSNVYLEMAEKYKIEEALKDMLECDESLKWVTIQGETYGPGIQKRDYHAPEHMFMAFNLIDSNDGRWDSVEASEYLTKYYNIPWVPILDQHYVLPGTVEELLAYATGESVCDHDMREGLVFRSPDGVKSFKAVSNEFLMKYHS